MPAADGPAVAPRQRFESLAERLSGQLVGDEFGMLGLSGERSAFVRFNGGRIRQSGTVARDEMSVRLVDGQRQASVQWIASGDPATDRQRLDAALVLARERLAAAEPDPYLLVERGVPAAPGNTGSDAAGAIGDAGDDDAHARSIADHIVSRARAGGAGDLGGTGGITGELIGFLASGPLYRGLATSAGARHWFASRRDTFEFTIQTDPARAVKKLLSAARLDPQELSHAIEEAAALSSLMSKPPVDVPPGRYRALLAPAAAGELVSMFGWHGTSLRAHRTGQSTLAAFHDGERRFAPAFTLADAPSASGAPLFQQDGFAIPSRLLLVDRGGPGRMLVSPRSEREFQVPHTGSDPFEGPHNLELAPGTLARADELAALGTGLLVGNLWYLNWSDRGSARVTGMTRYATFWVEQGRIVGPVNRLRFDESLYDAFGDGLEALGAQAPLLADPSTYDGRTTASSRVPALLLRAFTVTL